MNIRTISQMAAQPTVAFIILMGVVSLFADMTHEAARSIYGAYLPLLGLSATMIGFVTGLGEFIGYALRLLTGIIADKSRNYWEMAMLGYGINVIAIPTLALVPENGWMLACMLIILERTGKAIRQPAKNTLLSYASSQIGLGKGFAVQEFLDQVGAFLGPVLLFCVLWLKNGENSLEAYAACFATLTIPALLTMFFLLKARRKFPHPELFEQDTEIDMKYKTRKRFLLYILAIGCFALGFVDFPTDYHACRQASDHSRRHAPFTLRRSHAGGRFRSPAFRLAVRPHPFPGFDYFRIARCVFRGLHFFH